MALLVCPVATAATRDFLNERRWDSRWMIGHRSVDRPRRVSTALSAEMGIEVTTGPGGAQEVVWILAFGGLPSERAAITS